MTDKKHVNVFKSEYTAMVYTVVLEKFTVGYFCVKIVYGKIFMSLGGFKEKFLTTNCFSGPTFYCCSQT